MFDCTQTHIRIGRLEVVPLFISGEVQPYQGPMALDKRCRHVNDPFPLLLKDLFSSTSGLVAHDFRFRTTTILLSVSVPHSPSNHQDVDVSMRLFSHVLCYRFQFMPASLRSHSNQSLSVLERHIHQPSGFCWIQAHLASYLHPSYTWLPYVLAKGSRFGRAKCETAKIWLTLLFMLTIEA